MLPRLRNMLVLEHALLRESEAWKQILRAIESASLDTIQTKKEISTLSDQLPKVLKQSEVMSKELSSSRSLLEQTRENHNVQNQPQPCPATPSVLRSPPRKSPRKNKDLNPTPKYQAADQWESGIHSFEYLDIRRKLSSYQRTECVSSRNDVENQSLSHLFL